MQQRTLLVSVWVVATVVMMAVTYSAINLVGSQVNERPISATATTISQAPNADDSDAATSTSSQSQTSGTTGESTSTSVDGGSTTSTTTDGATTSTAPGTSSTTSTTDNSTSTTTPTSTSTTSTTSPSTTSTTSPDDDDDDPVVETGPFVISSAGGVVTVSCLGDSVAFLRAFPNAGYSYEIEEKGPSRVRVEFENSDTSWRVQATCNDGVMTSDVSES